MLGLGGGGASTYDYIKFKKILVCGGGGVLPQIRQ